MRAKICLRLAFFPFFRRFVVAVLLVLILQLLCYSSFVGVGAAAGPYWALLGGVESQLHRMLRL